MTALQILRQILYQALRHRQISTAVSTMDPLIYQQVSGPIQQTHFQSTFG